MVISFTVGFVVPVVLVSAYVTLRRRRSRRVVDDPLFVESFQAEVDTFLDRANGHLRDARYSTRSGSRDPDSGVSPFTAAASDDGHGEQSSGLHLLQQPPPEDGSPKPEESSGQSRPPTLVSRMPLPEIDATNVSQDLLCPITQDVMEDPVIADDGYTYERSAIEHWFARCRGHPTSPMTNEQLRSNNLIPNRIVKSMIANLTQTELERIASPNTEAQAAPVAAATTLEDPVVAPAIAPGAQAAARDALRPSLAAPVIAPGAQAAAISGLRVSAMTSFESGAAATSMRAHTPGTSQLRPVVPLPSAPSDQQLVTPLPLPLHQQASVPLPSDHRSVVPLPSGHSADLSPVSTIDADSQPSSAGIRLDMPSDAIN
eukprot:gene5035-6136_t